MTKPKELSRIARAVLEHVQEALMQSQEDYLEFNVLIAKNQKAAAAELIRDIANRNSASVIAITYLLAEKPHDAERVILNATVKRHVKGKQNAKT
jgi:hypothetical protein